MTRKTIVPASPVVTSTNLVSPAALVVDPFDIGLVRTAERGGKPAHLLTSSEVGRQAGLPGAWGTKGYHANLLAEAAGLITRTAWGWKPTVETVLPAAGTSLAKRIDGRWRWYPSVVDRIRKANKEFSLEDLKKKAQEDRWTS